MCANKKLPLTGAPSAAQAEQYVICASEHVINDLYLVEDVKVQVGQGRPYNSREDINFPNIDTRFPVYPIRGSLKKYACTQIYLDRSNVNANCSIYNQPNATGACYKDNFGDWHCSMTDASGVLIERNAPPPGALKQVRVTSNKSVENKQNQDKDKVANFKNFKANYPKPDFSAMEKWYEIVRYEYPEPGSREMNVYLKLKTMNPATEFWMEFKDKDGIKLQDKEASMFSHMPGFNGAEVGEVVKVQISTPDEKILRQVVFAKVFPRL